MLMKTSQCSAFGHPEFNIECDAIWAESGTLNWFTDWLEASVKGGKVFQPGETVQLGWSILRIGSDEDGCLKFLEPDFVSLPVNFVTGVSQSLHHLFVQKSVADTAGLNNKLDIPSLRMSVIVCSKFSAKGPQFLSRTEQQDNDSGWFFGCVDPSHDHSSMAELSCVSLYQAALKYGFDPMAYLGLPSGTDVVVAGHSVEIYRDGQPLQIRDEGVLVELALSLQK